MTARCGKSLLHKSLKSKHFCSSFVLAMTQRRTYSYWTNSFRGTNAVERIAAGQAAPGGAAGGALRRPAGGPMSSAALLTHDGKPGRPSVRDIRFLITSAIQSAQTA